MKKIVVNKKYGGFGLSDLAIKLFAARKGLTLYPEEHERFPDTLGPVYWLVPEGERTGILSDNDWRTASTKARMASNKRYAELVLDDRDIPRDDLDLVAVVEELGGAASDKFARLEITEIPEDVDWFIQEYDGLEWVAEKHRTW